MKKALLIALFSLWSWAAQAGITCTLPFTLTNGTTADASQVMANYNALVACLARAAAAGTNTDITSLVGLTTPLPASEGGTRSYATGAGVSTGSANAQIINSLTPGNYSLTAGNIVYFMAGFTNSGPMTWNVNGTGAVNVVLHTATGVSALSGGEVVAGQVTVGYYDGVEYQLLDAAPPTGLVQPCTEIGYQGATSPSGYLPENGQAVLRASFPNLFACMAISGVAATTTITSTSVAVTNSLLFQVGWSIGGNNVTCNSTITSIPDGFHIVISNPASASGSTTLTIGPQPQGDCATTFNVPNMNGRAAVGIDTTGGHLSATACPNPASVGTACGSLTQQIQTANLPPYTPAGGVAVSITGGSGNQGLQSGTGGPVNIGGTGSGGTNVGLAAVATFSGTPQGGTQTPFLLQPVGLELKAIKF